MNEDHVEYEKPTIEDREHIVAKLGLEDSPSPGGDDALAF